MKISRILNRLARDCHGNAVVEFAIAGPIFLGFLLGVFQVGVQVQNYNALRSASIDVGRAIVVEYQKGNQLTTQQIQSRAASIAIESPYLLDGEKLDILVVEPTSRVTGAREFTLTLEYMLPNWLQFIGAGDAQMSYDRSIFVSIAP